MQSDGAPNAVYNKKNLIHVVQLLTGYSDYTCTVTKPSDWLKEW
jgi:hypothetical protein